MQWKRLIPRHNDNQVKEKVNIKREILTISKSSPNNLKETRKKTKGIHESVEVQNWLSFNSFEVANWLIIEKERLHYWEEAR